MKARWLIEIGVTSIGLLAVAACATGTSTVGGEGGSGGNNEWTGPSSSSSSSSSNGAGGGSSSSSNGAGGGASSSSSSASSASSASSGGVCMETPCKLVSPQCGCAAGEMCTIDGTGTRLCYPEGTVAIGQQCTGAGDCAAGGLCVKSGGTISTCMKYCSSDMQCTGPGGICAIVLNDGSSGQIPNVTLCAENCDPSTNVGCPVTGTSCQLGQEAAGQMRFLTRCTSSGTKTQGAACTTNADCAPTYGCFNTGSNQCLKYCKVGGAACPGGATCNTIGTIGNTDYGACL